MPTIRKRGRSWQVQIRLKGCQPISRTFATKADAVAWGRESERTIDRNSPTILSSDSRSVTVADLLSRYVETITVAKRSERSERSRIRTILAHAIAEVPVAKLKAAQVARYRDDRLKRVGSDAVRRELTILRHCLTVAMREWDAPLVANPVLSIAIPPPSKVRNTRLDEDAARRLLAAIGPAHAWYLRPMLLLAIETGMRRGELVSLLWADVKLNHRTAHLPNTKNGHSRTIPLTPRAIATLKQIPIQSTRVFPLSGNAVRLAWDRLRLRAGLPGLRFHQLRHEAISLFFEKGLSVPEVALISGHRDLRCLQRYVHLRPEDLARKIAQMDERGYCNQNGEAASWD